MSLGQTGIRAADVGAQVPLGWGTHLLLQLQKGLVVKAPLL